MPAATACRRCFICGQTIHKELEKVIADYFGGGHDSLTSPASTPTAACSNRFFSEEDAIISDSLNHGTIIRRLCKAVRYRYANADMGELEECLKKAQAQRFRIIVTDGVFSMDGNAAPLRSDLRSGGKSTTRW